MAKYTNKIKNARKRDFHGNLLLLDLKSLSEKAGKTITKLTIKNKNNY